MRRIVFDTNVIVSAYIHKKFSRLVFDYCSDSHLIFVSAWILREVQVVLIRKFGVSEDLVENVIQTIRNRTTVIDPTTPLPTVCRDPDDNNLLQLCDTIQSDYLITGDADLLILKTHGKCSIVTVREFYNKLIGGN